MKVILLDRDGTVVVEPPHRDVTMAEFEFFPDAMQALKRLADAGYAVIFITNQSGIADRGLSVEEYEATQERMLKEIEPTGLKVLKTYMCPHGDNDVCECRKPKPGMILEAANDFDIDLSDTYMVGDNVTDVEAAKAAGGKAILLRQGINSDETRQADYIADNLLEAVAHVLKG